MMSGVGVGLGSGVIVAVGMRVGNEIVGLGVIEGGTGEGGGGASMLEHWVRKGERIKNTIARKMSA